MTIDINTNLIEKFRYTVNEENFFREKFTNSNGKNLWNTICSAMDWITVAAEGLPSILLTPKKAMGYNHKETLNLMQYIITIDILVESIIQLYRVLDGKQPYPLTRDCGIFKHEKLSDDKYFKHLRAVFSTHPVNLDSLDGVKSGNGERFFASWVSSGGMLEYDYIVSLYSSIPEKDKFHFLGVNLNEVNLYAEKRYNLLEDLMSKVTMLKTNHVEDCKKNKIQLVSNPIEQFSILFDENKKRFGTNYCYAENIRYCYRLLKVDLSSIRFEDFEMETLHEYKSFLISLIPEMIDGLQNMTWKSIDLNFCSWNYEFEKIYSYFIDEEHPLGEAFFNKLVKKGPLPSNLSSSNDFNLKQLVLDAYLFRELKRTGKPINYEEMIGRGSD